MGANMEMAGDGSLCVHGENIHSLASLFSLCYSTHKSSILRGRERVQRWNRERELRRVERSAGIGWKCLSEQTR